VTVIERVLYQLGRGLLWVVFHLFFRVDVTGKELVPRTGRLLVVANHLSPIEPALLGTVLPRRLQFLAAAELVEVPGWGPLIRWFGSIPVDRSRFDPLATRRVVRRLQAGAVVGMFPEGRIRLGTNSILSDDPELKEGAAVIAALARAPVLPVIVRGTRQVLDWRQWFRRARLEVTIGAPFCLWVPAGLSAGDRRARRQQTLTGRLQATIPVTDGARGNGCSSERV